MKTSFGQILSAPAVRRVAQFVLAGSAVAFVAGCASEPESHVVSAPPPAPPTTVLVSSQQTPITVVTQPVVAGVSSPAVNTYVVTQPPPVLQQEVVLARPSSAHVWVAGYWTWQLAERVCAAGGAILIGYWSGIPWIFGA